MTTLPARLGTGGRGKIVPMKKEIAKRIKDFIHDHPDVYLEKARKTGYICKLCGNGTGESGTGIETKDGVHFTCFRCRKYTCADVIDIIGMERGVTDYPSKFKLAIDRYRPALLASGFSHDDLEYGNTVKSPRNKFANLQNKFTQQQSTDNRTMESQSQSSTPTGQGTGTETPSTPPVVRESKKDVDVTELCDKWHESIDDTTYLQERGLSKSTLDHFNIGYCKGWIHPDSKSDKPFPRDVVIIPTSQYSYLARGVKQGFKFFGQFGNRRIFNVNALYTSDKPVFVVESEIDAMSIFEAGGTAVALGGVGQVNLFLKVIKAQKPTQPLIVSLDNDTAGREHQKTLVEHLKMLGIPHYEIAIGASLDCKDANEMLVKNRDAFTKDVTDAIDLVRCTIADQMDVALEEIRADSVSYALDGFLNRIEASKHATVYPTNFENIDKLLDGGLYAGLYIVGAISSLGKTTFCLQIGDQLAKQGYDVLVFSLEMARDELIAKSISRLTRIFTDDRRNAKTTRGILTGSRHDKYNNIEKALIHKSIAEYKSFGHRLYIHEGMGDITVAHIRDKVAKHHEATGRAPVVIVDYLQIIAPRWDHRGATDKQNTDFAVLELKKLSRDFNIPVIGISSFNRENYNNPVNLASFKESGAIEYSSDVLIGLQYNGMDFEAGENSDDKPRKKRIYELRKQMEIAGRNGDAQSIQVKILKNRNGSKGATTLYFIPMFNCFSTVENPHAISNDIDLF